MRHSCVVVKDSSSHHCHLKACFELQCVLYLCLVLPQAGCSASQVGPNHVNDYLDPIQTSTGRHYSTAGRAGPVPAHSTCVCGEWGILTVMRDDPILEDTAAPPLGRSCSQIPLAHAVQNGSFDYLLIMTVWYICRWSCILGCQPGWWS